MMQELGMIKVGELDHLKLSNDSPLSGMSGLIYNEKRVTPAIVPLLSAEMSGYNHVNLC